MLLKLLREGLGRVFVFFDWLSRPKPVKRADGAQEAVESSAAQLALYQFYACPFCIKVRRQIHALNLPIRVCDAQNDGERRKELAAGGGKVKVPCLRIEEAGQVQWLYESNDIIHYLNQRFGDA